MKTILEPSLKRSLALLTPFNYMPVWYGGKHPVGPHGNIKDGRAYSGWT